MTERYLVNELEAFTVTLSATSQALNVASADIPFGSIIWITSKLKLFKQ